MSQCVEFMMPAAAWVVEEAALEAIFILVTTVLFWVYRLRAPLSTIHDLHPVPPMDKHDCKFAEDDSIKALLARKQWAQALDMYLGSRATLAAETDHSVFDGLVVCAARCNRFDAILEIVGDMKKHDVRRTRSMYESAMRVLSSQRDYSAAANMYRAMVADSVMPSSDAQSGMVGWWVPEGDMRGARAMFEGGFRPAIRAYMQVLRAVSKAGGRQSAVDTLVMVSHMHRGGVKMDAICLNVALGTLVNAGEVVASQELLAVHSSLADTISYNIVIKGLVRTGRPAEAWDHVSEMDRLGLPVSRPTFLSFVNSRNEFSKDALARLRLLDGRGR
jgi:pentatricopeptide repeat protein